MALHIESPVAVAGPTEPWFEWTEDNFVLRNPLVQIVDIGAREAGTTARHIATEGGSSVRTGMFEAGNTLRHTTNVTADTAKHFADRASDTALYVIGGLGLLALFATR